MACRARFYEGTFNMSGISDYCDTVLARVASGRLLSVDIFRGIAITGMILVSNHGSQQHAYAPMRHAEWHGWTLTDLIFPFFLFVVGISMVMSFDKQSSAGRSRSEIMKAATIRGLKLIGLGLFLGVFYYNFYDPSFNWWTERIEGIRYSGVLQRIGVVFFLTAAIVLAVKSLRGRLAVFFAAIFGYWALMVYMPYTLPSGETAVGLWDYGNNLAAAIDQAVLGRGHTYFRDTQPFAFDLLGVLSTMTAVATCMSGVLAGMLLSSNRETGNKAAIFLGLGLAATFTALLWDATLPINKPIWTSSYVVLTSGLAAVMLSALIWIVDMCGYRRWGAPLVVFGANSIAFYMLSGVVGKIMGMVRFDGVTIKTMAYQSVMEPLFGPAGGSLAFGIFMLMIYYVVMNAMYKRGIFWKV